MVELTCIVCPVSCSLAVAEGPAVTDGLAAISVSGNRCPRGAAYAQEEICSPKRIVTATCAVSRIHDAAALKRIPVKTSAPCSKEKIPALLADIYAAKVVLPVKAGDTVIADWKGSGIDIVAVRSIA